MRAESEDHLLHPQPSSAPASGWSLPEELRQIADDGAAEVLHELFAVFQQDTATRLNEIDAAIRDPNRSVIRSQAHSLKGSSAQLGAPRMAELCLRLEQLAATGSSGEMESLLGEIREAFAQVCARLVEAGFCDTLVPPGRMQ